MTEKIKTNRASLQAYGTPSEGYFYELQVVGVTALYFTECDYLGNPVEIFSYVDGDEYAKKEPNRSYTNPITLKRPFDDDLSIWEWVQNFRTIGGKDAAIIAYDETSSEIARWNLINAWPSRLVTQYDENNQGFDVLTLAYDELTRAN